MFSEFLANGGGILEAAAELGNDAVSGLSGMANALKNKVTGVESAPGQGTQITQPPPIGGATGQLAGKRRRRGRKSRKASRKVRKTRKH